MSDNVDWTTIMDLTETTTSTTVDSGVFYTGPSYIKLSNGLMIVYGFYYVSDGIAANGMRDISVSLSTPFLREPFAIAGMTSTSTSPTMGDVSVAVTQTTTTKLIFRVFNCGGSLRRPGINYIAIGKWE